MTQHQIQVGQIKVNLPDENQNSFSIFEDLAELFEKEYQSEAIKLLKSQIKDVKPKPSIDSESDFTSITTSNIDTLLFVINAIIHLSTEENKESFAKVDKLELEKIFANAKKNKPKPKKWKLGDVFSIPLLDKSFSFGQVLAKEFGCTCVLFEASSKGINLEHSDFEKLKPISILHLTGMLLNNGKWTVLFNETVRLNPDSGCGGKDGDVGSTSYSDSTMEGLANAYWGLKPWNVEHVENFYDDILLTGISRPNNAIILNHAERQKYRYEKFGITS